MPHSAPTQAKRPFARSLPSRVIGLAIAVAAALMTIASSAAAQAADSKHPNIVLIMADDLGYAELSARSVEKAWLDLIFEAPFMNAVGLRDVILSRHPRAQI